MYLARGGDTLLASRDPVYDQTAFGAQLENLFKVDWNRMGHRRGGKESLR